MSNLEVIKHSSAIQVTNNVPFIARRMWNVLLARAYDGLLDHDIHTILVEDLIEQLGISTRNRMHLKESLRTLATTAVEFNVLGKDKKEKWGISTMLAQAEIHNGLCTYAFSPFMRSRLYNPRIYARISLSIQNRFGGKHSLALYELAVDYFDNERQEGETPFIPIETFRELLGLEDGSYEEFKTLNRDVIKRATNEINKKSDLFLTVQFKREKRRTVAVKFHIKRNQRKKTNGRLKNMSAKKESILQQNMLFPDMQEEQDAFRTWYDKLSEQEQKQLRHSATNMLSLTEKAMLEKGEHPYTVQFQIDMNMRKLWKEMEKEGEPAVVDAVVLEESSA